MARRELTGRVVRLETAAARLGESGGISAALCIDLMEAALVVVAGLHAGEANDVAEEVVFKTLGGGAGPDPLPDADLVTRMHATLALYVQELQQHATAGGCASEADAARLEELDFRRRAVARSYELSVGPTYKQGFARIVTELARGAGDA